MASGSVAAQDGEGDERDQERQPEREQIGR